MCIPNKTNSLRSAGVSPASENAGETPALRLIRRAIPWLAVLALTFAWSGQALAKPKTPPKKPSDIKTVTNVAVEQSKAAKSGDGTTTVTVTVTGGGIGQFPTTLDQALAAALETSPKVMAAKARVTLAEAELSSAQMDVARKIVQLWTERQTRQLFYEDKIAANKMVPGPFPAPFLIEAGAAVTQAEMELRCLIGQASSIASRGSPSNPTATFERPAKPLQLPRGSTVEKVRNALLSPTEIVFADAPLQEVVDYLKERLKIEILVDAKALAEAGITPEKPITCDLKQPSFAAVLQAWDDVMPELKVVVRDYGLLVTTPERARQQGYFPAIEFARLSQGGATYEQSPLRDAIPGPTYAPPTPGQLDIIPANPATPQQQKKATDPFSN